MTPIRRFRRAAAALVLALLALSVPLAPATARQQTAPDFDHYLLSLSVAPSFCALSLENRTKAECRKLTGAAFQRTPLTVHGLWPNRAKRSVNLQPKDCNGPRFAPPPADQRAALDRFMPGGISLARYEWRKHGACSGLAQNDYFAAMLRLAEQADATIGAALRERRLFGTRVPTPALLDAVAARDPAWAAAVVVDCRQPRGGGEPLIAEIRVVFSKDFAPIPAGTVGMGQNSGCPAAGGFLPDGPLP